jgi:hypothetical protein
MWGKHNIYWSFLQGRLARFRHLAEWVLWSTGRSLPGSFDLVGLIQWGREKWTLSGSFFFNWKLQDNFCYKIEVYVMLCYDTKTPVRPFWHTRYKYRSYFAYLQNYTIIIKRLLNILMMFVLDCRTVSYSEVKFFLWINLILGEYKTNSTDGDEIAQVFCKTYYNFAALVKG